MMRQSMTWAVVFLLVLAGLFSCGKSNDESDPNVNYAQDVIGTLVYSSSGLPVSNESILVAGTATTTGSTGSFRLHTDWRNTTLGNTIEIAGNTFETLSIITTWVTNTDGSREANLGTVQVSSNAGGSSYSNATLTGPWITTTYDVAHPVDSEYIVFDGSGHVTSWGVWDITSATYSVQSSGAITLSLALNNGGAATLTAQLISSTTATGNGQQGPFNLVQITNQAACQGTWTGTFQETQGGTATHSLSFTIDSSGAVTAFTGFSGPVSGNMFCQSGTMAGFFKTSQAAPYDNVRIYGTVSGNNITGEAESNSDSVFILGTLTLTKQ